MTNEFIFTPQTFFNGLDDDYLLELIKEGELIDLCFNISLQTQPLKINTPNIA